MLWLAGCVAGCKGSGSAVVIQGDPSAAESGSEELAWSSQEKTEAVSGQQTLAEEETVTAARIYVHICGQVCMPGVYSLPEGSRVWDAVEAAGGLTDEAQPEAVNLALVVADGSKVTIPTQTQAQDAGFRWYETGTGAGGSTLTDGSGSGIIVGQSDAYGVDGRVDLNRADVNALMTIPGIGQSRAEAIVAYRETKGPFESIEEIMQIAGIKEGLFGKIRDYITVGG